MTNVGLLVQTSGSNKHSLLHSILVLNIDKYCQIFQFFSCQHNYESVRSLNNLNNVSSPSPD
jgi:hypothetical protein